MVMADVLAPSGVASIMGFMGALILTIALNIGLDQLPMLFIAEMCPLGWFCWDLVGYKDALVLGDSPLAFQAHEQLLLALLRSSAC